jgi:hypothetical protein
MISKQEPLKSIRNGFSIEPSFTKKSTLTKVFHCRLIFCLLRLERKRGRERENCIEREMIQRSNFECVYGRQLRVCTSWRWERWNIPRSYADKLIALLYSKFRDILNAEREDTRRSLPTDYSNRYWRFLENVWFRLFLRVFVHVLSQIRLSD